MAGEPGLVRVTEGDLQRRVMDQPSFSAADVLVAVRGEEVVGFAHVGPRTNFWSCLSERKEDRTEGHIYALVAEPADGPLTRLLLEAAMERLARAGARQVLLYPTNLHGTVPFYNGIAGAFEVPGLSTGRTELQNEATAFGFSIAARYATSELDLSDRAHVSSLVEEGSRLWEPAVGRGIRERRGTIEWAGLPTRCAVDLTRNALLRGPRLIARAAYAPWEEYSRQHGRQVFGISAVRVIARWRGRGLGKLVVIRAMQAAIEAGAEMLHLLVDRSNEPAWNLYHRSLGFQPRHDWVTLAKTLR
jgi:ribosomal protein S18 acetylase RimI-like enzyme